MTKLKVKKLVAIAAIYWLVPLQQANAVGIAATLTLDVDAEFTGCGHEAIAVTRTVPYHFLTHYMFTSLTVHVTNGATTEYLFYDDLSGSGFSLQTVSDDAFFAFNFPKWDWDADSDHIALYCSGSFVIEFERYKNKQDSC